MLTHKRQVSLAVNIYQPYISFLVDVVNVSLNPLYNLLPTTSIPAAINRTDAETALLLQNKTIYFLAIPADATTFSRNPVSTLIGLSQAS